MSQAISEEMKLQDEWYERAKTQTLTTLPAFLEELTQEYAHDYGTICHAIAAAAIGAAWAVNHSDAARGGITGFQAGAIMWLFLQHWMDYDQPMSLLDYEEMLYPQYADKFDKVISPETWQWLQKEAAKRLADDHGTDEVRAHWRRIVLGIPPFGYRVGHV